MRPGRCRTPAYIGKFCFPLGARRALDYAAFFEPRDNELARLKEEQAALFGRAVVLSKQDTWTGIARVLEELAGKEERFKKRILSISSVQ